ncbi:hypothetical protein, partial [Bradyrhizobium sp. SZCCHNS1049]|uniref:hypothetical protein n=1 Tax=Bradyrhizobium sp. SZCCHNS1049 TaxID=3057299 RepID=UPI002916A2C7
PLPPPGWAHPTARTNSDLDKTWGQGQNASITVSAARGKTVRWRSRVSSIMPDFLLEFCGLKSLRVDAATALKSKQ